MELKRRITQNLFSSQYTTAQVLVPSGATSFVQPLDIVFNASFKDAIDRLATAHLQENLDAYVKGQINASERRVLFTKWVGTD